MEDQRDVQTSKRNGSSRSVLSAGSAVAMEIKRKKIRQSTLFLQTEKNTNIQEKLDFEMRMREGAYKLLLACSKREQVLNASKNLLTCNARIKAYVSQLQRKKEEQDMGGAMRLPSSGVVLSDADGSEVFATEMIVVDRSVTDICFEGVTVFKDADPQFELKVELWSCALEDELTMVNTPKKLAKKLRNSFGKTAGKKLCPLLDSPDPDTFLQYNPLPPGAKYSLLAYTTLCLPDAEGSFQSHSLIVLQGDESSSWLPLYGNLCCRGMYHCCSLYCVLSAGVLSCYFTPEEIDAKVQPSLKVPVNKHCSLFRSISNNPYLITVELIFSLSMFSVTFLQDTRVRLMEKESSGHKSRSLSIINPSPEGSETIVFTTETREELEDWLDALHQHLYDQSQWLHCCNQLMKIEVTSPRKPSLFLTKQADSVYNDLSIHSPGKFESITDMIHNKIEQTDGRFLIGPEEEKEAPNWSTLFEGTNSMVVQKGVLSQSKTSTPCASPNPNTSSTSIQTSNKKRRAPPPPSDRKPPATASRPARPPLPPSLHHAPPPSHQEKENSSTSRPTTRSRTGRPSLDAKFSAIIQQLQRSNGGAGAQSRKHAPLGILDVQPHSEPPPLQQLEQHHQPQQTEAAGEHAFLRPSYAPVPATRSKLRKSFRERMNFKAL
ncbi:hypothetical protein F7725_023826 [Dissostichus mawsoni]|uniref:Rhotekin 2 n=1 Tax=Dissostichus mawsoni TaxID=36200 RepID=A0A7J5XXM4_DISMA|nr:hypothetical protein F7725_023826 [Dissostichus mawsoni]